jgi:hypothetical protein
MSSGTPQWKYRRLASRAARIVKRRGPQSPAVGAFLATLVPNADKYVAAYDKLARFQAIWKREMAEGRGTIATLLRLMQEWLPLLKRDIPGFDGGIYGDNPTVPDDVIEDGERLLSVIDEFRDKAGNPLGYQKLALDALTPAVQAAIKEWGEAEAADKEYQTAFATVREAGSLLQQDLVALRRTLLATAGRADKDYQKLRSERAGYPDEDDDPNAPVPPKPVEAAPADAGPRSASAG